MIYIKIYLERRQIVLSNEPRHVILVGFLFLTSETSRKRSYSQKIKALVDETLK